uniref:Protein krueppel n=1 Tax=Anopheles minimus TaxID=112268 RepID=A0A182VU59_9DIPT
MEIMQENIRAERLKSSQTCRFCLSQGVRLSSIYTAQEQNKTTPLALQIIACVGIEVYSDDGMPSMICEHCRILMNYCYQFKQMCNNADTQLKTFLSTGMWPKQLSLPKELASLVSNLKQSPHRATKPLENVESLNKMEKRVNIIKLSPTDLKNIKMGQKIKLEHLGVSTTSGKSETVLSVDNEDKFEPGPDPLLTSTPIVKRPRAELTRHSEASIPGQQETKQKSKQQTTQVHKVYNGPVILNNLFNHVTPKVEEEFVSTGEGTVEMIMTYKWEHEQSAKKPDVFPCTECQKTYPLKQLLDIHNLSHKRERNYPCDQCEKRFYSKYDLAKHSATHTGERPYICVICRASFSRSTLLTRHQAKHKDEPKHVCKFCERAFLSLDELNKHIENHEKHRPFKCALCPKRFAYKQGLERHEVVHKEKLPYQCEYCDQSYLTPGKLSRHLVTHAGERPYPCRLCNKSFLLSHHLSRHLRRHNASGQSEYKCVDCKALLNSMGELVYHSAQHAMQNLICPLCREPFEDVDKVTEHIKSHAEQLHYACDYCDLMYTSEQKLNQHCLQRHANELAYELPKNKYQSVQPDEGVESQTIPSTEKMTKVESIHNTGVPQANYTAMEYENLVEDEIYHDLLLEEDESTLVPDPLNDSETFEITEIELRAEDPKEIITNDPLTLSPTKVPAKKETTKATTVTAAETMKTVTAAVAATLHPSINISSSQPGKSKTIDHAEKSSRQQRMEEFYKRNQQAVDKKMAQKKVADVLKSLPKGVTVTKPTTATSMVKGSSNERLSVDQSKKETSAVVPSATIPQKRGPGRPPKVKAIADTKDVTTGAKEVKKGDINSVVPKHSILPMKPPKPPTEDVKKELKRSASAIEVSRERPKVKVEGQENSANKAETQSWMIKRTYAPKELTGKKRPADRCTEDSEDVPNKRPALSRKTLNPSMIRVMCDKEKGQRVGGAKPSTTVSSTTVTNSTNLKRIAKPEIVQGIPVEMNIGGKTIKVHKISKEEVIARAAAQRKGNS